MDLSAFFESDLPVEEQKTEEFLAKLDEEGWRRFLSVAQRLAFRANETVVSQADISRTGSVRIFVFEARGVGLIHAVVRLWLTCWPFKAKGTLST